MQTARLRIGTRGSPLALVQAGIVRTCLARARGVEEDAFEVVPIRTTGDRITDRPLAEVGGKGMFSKEIDIALVEGHVDLAVHSAKDLETHMPPGIAIAACLEREDVRDAFLSSVAGTLGDLPSGATVGTASLRRAALVRHARPDLTVVPMRGNVQTRLAKLGGGEADATLLALAGLNRLGLADRATCLIETDGWLPAAGQGVVAVTVREGDAKTAETVAIIDHGPTSTALNCERAYLAALDGSCHTPIGGHARIAGADVDFNGIILKVDGSDPHTIARRGPFADAVAIGREAGEVLRAAGGPGYFDEG